MGLIEDLPRAATVVAEQPTTCALLAKWDFQNELRDDPEIALSLLPVLTGRIRELDSLLAQAKTQRRASANRFSTPPWHRPPHSPRIGEGRRDDPMRGTAC